MSFPGSAVTVVIPVWGARYVETLDRAIASVRDQDEAVPIVVVDNASEAEVPGSAGVVVIHSPRRLSAGAARNFGLERVVTEYVVLLDADDELVPGALALLLQGIESDRGIAVHSMSLVEADTGTRHRTPRRFASVLARAPRLFALATAVWSLYPINGNAIMRTPWVRESGGYPDCSGGEDWVLGVSQALRGRVVLDPRPGRVYHAHPESLWRRTQGSSDLAGAARHVRARLSKDPATPNWMRATIPLIAILQTLLIRVARPLFHAARRHHPDVG